MSDVTHTIMLGQDLNEKGLFLVIFCRTLVKGRHCKIEGPQAEHVLLASKTFDVKYRKSFDNPYYYHNWKILSFFANSRVFHLNKKQGND